MQEEQSDKGTHPDNMETLPLEEVSPTLSPIHRMQSLSAESSTKGLTRGLGASNLSLGEEMVGDTLMDDDDKGEDPEEEGLTDDEVVLDQDNETIQILSEDEERCCMSPGFKTKGTRPETETHPNDVQHEGPTGRKGLFDDEIEGVSCFNPQNIGKHGTPLPPPILTPTPEKTQPKPDASPEKTQPKPDASPEKPQPKPEVSEKPTVEEKVHEEAEEEVTSEPDGQEKAFKSAFQVGYFI